MLAWAASRTTYESWHIDYSPEHSPPVFYYAVITVAIVQLATMTSQIWQQLICSFLRVVVTNQMKSKSGKRLQDENGRWPWMLLVLSSASITSRMTSTLSHMVQLMTDFRPSTVSDAISFNCFSDCRAQIDVSRILSKLSFSEYDIVSLITCQVLLLHFDYVYLWNSSSSCPPTLRFYFRFQSSNLASLTLDICASVTYSSPTCFRLWSRICFRTLQEELFLDITLERHWLIL